jgi:hypothetical protein
MGLQPCEDAGLYPIRRIYKHQHSRDLTIDALRIDRDAPLRVASKPLTGEMRPTEQQRVDRVRARDIVRPDR